MRGHASLQRPCSPGQPLACACACADLTGRSVGRSAVPLSVHPFVWSFGRSFVRSSIPSFIWSSVRLLARSPGCLPMRPFACSFDGCLPFCRMGGHARVLLKTTLFREGGLEACVMQRQQHLAAPVSPSGLALTHPPAFFPPDSRDLSLIHGFSSSSTPFYPRPLFGSSSLHSAFSFVPAASLSLSLSPALYFFPWRFAQLFPRPLRLSSDAEFAPVMRAGFFIASRSFPIPHSPIPPFFTPFSPLCWIVDRMAPLRLFRTAKVMHQRAGNESVHVVRHVDTTTLRRGAPLCCPSVAFVRDPTTPCTAWASRVRPDYLRASLLALHQTRVRIWRFVSTFPY